jgi:tRNA threonylcarbamoyladenosine biosynthesis protein TsaE
LTRTPEPVRVVPCGAERADEVHRLTQAAFAEYRTLDPPSGALRETPARVGEDLAAGGGAIAELDGRAVGALRWQVQHGNFHVRRVAVDPAHQRQGIGRALMAWAEAEAQRRECTSVSAGVRVAVGGNIAFYRQLGYEVEGERRHEGYERATWLALRKKLLRGES